ncbi:MAG: amino acid adenylation domain-containing protein, partial [Psychrosphaera sp.]|nr:amino acid adenylation domain-containing protein [Psychrosphaera sp.]
ENYPMDMALEDTGLVMSDITAFEGTNYGLTLTLVLTDVLDIKFEHQRSRFTDTTATQMLGHFEQILKAMVDAPQGRVDTLPMLSAQEQHYLLNTVNEPQVDYAKSQSLHPLFEATVAQHPERIALVFEKEQLSYRELNQKANQLARRLRAQGVKPETLVGLMVERSLDTVIGLLAILKAGGAYVPLDPNYPQSRLDYMCQDSGIEYLLTHKDFNDVVLSTYSTANLPIIEGQSPDNLAYVIYTSGSTGQPKGVMVEHHNVVRLLQATQDNFNFDHFDVWTLFHSYAFDFSVWEIWGALAYGGRLVVIPQGMPQAYDDFYQLLIDEKVTVLNQTPSAFGQLSAIDAQQNGALSLRTVIFGGEALNLSSLSDWVERHGDDSPTLVNMYGITETTVHVTYRRILREDISANKGSLIGRPIGDLSLYILDPQLNPVPLGVCGEMFVGGAGVTRGYLHQAELTQSRFIENPHKKGERLYRTGDLALKLAGGELQYQGRIDSQVKIRGFRIELGEIEYQLSQLPGIKSAAVLAREDQPGLKRLVAYFISEDVTQNGDVLDGLAAQLLETLPEHMVPLMFVSMD